MSIIKPSNKSIIRIQLETSDKGEQQGIFARMQYQQIITEIKEIVERVEG